MDIVFIIIIEKKSIKQYLKTIINMYKIFKLTFVENNYIDFINCYDLKALQICASIYCILNQISRKLTNWVTYPQIKKGVNKAKNVKLKIKS